MYLDLNEQTHVRSARVFICVCRDPNTIFRGNSLTSKCIDETMKLAGMHYLQVTLKPIIDEVVTALQCSKYTLLQSIYCCFD